MRLTFLGATHEVTGSCYYLEAAGKKFLVDCGMEQGPNIYENKPISVPASQLDFVLITHAHIDHTGNLPLLYAHGFRGPIYMTPATVALSDIMLRDSAHIQLAEAEWRNRKNRRAGKEDYVTPYTMEDALGVIRLLEGIPYHQRVTLSDGIQIRFLDAGHLLGSASIELWLTEDGVTKKLLFSGRYRKYPSAADQRPGVPGERRLRDYGIHLRRPQPWPETGLCAGAGKNYSGNARPRRKPRDSVVCCWKNAGDAVLYS